MPHEHTPLLGEPKAPNKFGITKILAGLVGIFLASADKSILLATQGEIASTLNSPSSAPLLLVSYNLGFCIALPVYGFLCDIYGCRRFLLSAYVLFAAGCLLSGSVSTLWPFVLGRFVAGVGGAGMTDLFSVLINEIFTVTEAASLRGYLIAANILGSGCGGPLGGLIADLVGWRWSLIGQVPIGMFCLALAHWTLPVSERKSESQSQFGLWSFDYLGIGAFFISVSSFILATTDGVIFFKSSNTPIVLGISAAFLVVFILIERFVAKNPILPLSLIYGSGLSGILLGQVLFLANVNTILSNLPPYMSHIDHLSNSAIAVRIWPPGLGLIMGSVMAGRANSKILRYKKTSIAAIGVMLASQVPMIVRWANGIQGLEVYYCFPWAVGCGMLFTGQFIALTVSSPTEQMASATAAYYLSQQVGQIIGTSVSAMGLQQLFRIRLDFGLRDISLPERIQIISKTIEDYNFITKLPPQLQAAVQSSYIEAFRLIPALAFTLIALCGVIIILSKEKKIENDGRDSSRED